MISISFGLERGLVAFLLKVHMDLLFQRSMLSQVTHLVNSNVTRVTEFWLLRFCTDFTPTVSNKLPSEKKKKNRTGLIAGIVVGVGIVGSLLVFAVFFVRRRKRQSNNDFEGKLEKENRASFLFKLSDLLTVCRIHI